MYLCNINTPVSTDVTTVMTNEHVAYSRSIRCNSIKNWRLTVTLALILILAPALAFSATSKVKQSPKKERWFEVELIVFAHKKGQALESEKWPEITDFNPDASSPVEDPIPMPVAFVMLENEALQLNEPFKKLARSKNFEPLLHIAWRQPTFDKKNAQTILLYEGMTEPDFSETEKNGSKDSSPVTSSSTDENIEPDIKPLNPRFAGTISLSVARYLHFAADLVYRTPVTQRVAIPMPSEELWNESPYQSLSDPQGPAVQLESWKAMRGFRLKESRRMRSKRIHYLDHPFLGIVVLITPVELPKDPEELSINDPESNISSR